MPYLPIVRRYENGSIESLIEAFIIIKDSFAYGHAKSNSPGRVYVYGYYWERKSGFAHLALPKKARGIFFRLRACI